MANIVSVDYGKHVGQPAVVVLTDADEIVEVSYDEAGLGPGHWNRVLKALEVKGVTDDDHVLMAWQLGLIVQPWPGKTRS